MSGDQEIRIYQILTTINQNQNNLSKMVTTLIETNANSISGLSGQMNEFKNEAHDKIEKINKEFDALSQEVRTMLDSIILSNMNNKNDTEKLFITQNDRLEKLEEAYGEISVKICEDDIRENCKNWSADSKTINKVLEKNKNYETTKKTIKERFKNNIIDIITTPSKWPGLIMAMIGVVGFFYAVYSIVRDYFK